MKYDIMPHKSKVNSSNFIEVFLDECFWRWNFLGGKFSIDMEVKNQGVSWYGGENFGFCMRGFVLLNHYIYILLQNDIDTWINGCLLITVYSVSFHIQLIYRSAWLLSSWFHEWFRHLQILLSGRRWIIFLYSNNIESCVDFSP